MIGSQTPRICSIPEYVTSAGHDAIEVAALAGLELDDWQKFVLINSLGERPDGKWAAPTVGLVVGRQNGKNTILEARELAGLFLLGERTIIHSAHEQATSSEHFRRLLALIDGVPEFERRVKRRVHGKGSEAIELRNGQRVLFKTRTGGGGRGFTDVELLVFDEAMILSAAAKAALIPTMAASSIDGNTQTFYAASAVDQQNTKHDGIELARIREQAIKGHASIGWFEWSAPGDDPGAVTAEQAADPARIAMANPGLGIRISQEWVDHERTVELGAREFAVERQGVGEWPATDGSADRVIDLQKWNELTDLKSKMAGSVCFAFDVSPDRSSASISAAGARADGLGHVEVIDAAAGTGWVVMKIVYLLAAHENSGVVCDAAGPAGSLIPELTQAGIEVKTVTANEHAAACGIFYDAVSNSTLRHLGTAQLTAAVAGAVKRPLGDGGWAWSRKNSTVDITSLVAGTLAYWGAAIAEPEGVLLPPIFV